MNNNEEQPLNIKQACTNAAIRIGGKVMVGTISGASLGALIDFLVGDGLQNFSNLQRLQHFSLLCQLPQMVSIDGVLCQTLPSICDALNNTAKTINGDIAILQ